MKITDLREGNYVCLCIDDYGEFLKFDIDSGWNIDYLKPILLTDEILIKFGFASDKYEWWNGIISLGIFKDGLFLVTENHQKISIEIKYVHQLQNLYYALIGEELTFKK